MGAPEEVKAMQDSPDLHQKLNEKCFSQLFNLRIKAQVTVYEGQPRVKNTIMGAEPVNWTAMGQKLLVQLQELYGGLTPDCQAEVKELLQGTSGLKSVDGEGSFPASWANDFAKLQAVVA